MVKEAKKSEYILAALAYIFGPFIGPLNGILMILFVRRNDFVRFHAMQSTIWYGAIFIAFGVFSLLPIFGWFILPLLFLLHIVVWVFLMWKAFQGERYKLPYIGDIVETRLASLQ